MNKNEINELYVYALYEFGRHDGCPDNWSNMYEETLVGVFETEELALRYINTKASMLHLKLEKENDVVFLVSKADDCVDDCSIESGVCVSLFAGQIGWSGMYDEEGFIVKRVSLFMEHDIDYSDPIDES